MKTALQKLWVTILAVVSLVACDSPEPMTDDEATMWVTAYSPERIDMDATIRIESTDSLLAHLDTSRSLEKVFKFTPSVRGEARYVDGGKFIDFVPEKDGLKQGKQYNCRVNMSALTAIDSLKEFSFDFVVEKRESRFSDLRVSIDPDNVEWVVVSGKMLFSTLPSE